MGSVPSSFEITGGRRSIMTATRSSATAQVGVPGCPYRATTSFSTATFGTATTMRRDAALARASAPMVAKVLPLTTAKKARSRLARAQALKNVQVTDFDPLDPATAADPYPYY